MGRVTMGCMECTLCTGHAFTGMGRNAGRAMANVATLGVASLARKKCKRCTHPMSEHHTAQVVVQQVMAPIPIAQPAPQPVIQQIPMPPPPPQKPPGWYPNPQDPRQVCWWDGYRWHPETVHFQQPAVPPPPPPRQISG